jgi:GNAT superfamily N-acetyltransferase
MPSALLTGIIVRELKPEDISSLLELFPSAPDDGHLYVYTKHYEYPQELRGLYINWLRQCLCDHSTLTRVAVIPQENGQGTKAIGFSSWRCMFSDPKKPGKLQSKQWHISTWIDWLNLSLMRYETKYNGFYTWLHPSPSHRNNERHSALMKGRSGTPQSISKIPRYVLDGLAIHSDFQGCGIGSLLVRWGMDRAVEDGVPVFTGGEARGVDFYEGALGFKRIPETEYWLDSEGREISREEVEAGNVQWKKENGGVSGCDVFWCPDGVQVEI